MSTYSLAQLLQLWKQTEVTVEQMMGHLLQHLATLEQQMQALQQEVRTLRQERKQ